MIPAMQNRLHKPDGLTPSRSLLCQHLSAYNQLCTNPCLKTGMTKTFLHPTVAEIDAWYRKIGDKEYKLTSSETTHAPDSKNRTFYTYSFYLDEHYRHDRVVYERLSREQVEKLFDSIIQKLTVDNMARHTSA